MRHVTIHSDGTGHGTVLLDADGNKIDNIMSCNISIEANSFAIATVEVANVEVIVNAGVETVSATCPLCMGFIEHICDASFQSSMQTVQGTVKTHTFFDFELCGKITRHDNQDAMCYINRARQHDLHMDVKLGISWSNI